MREGGGEGPGFVSFGNVEDQTLLEAVVVVELVPEVLSVRNIRETNERDEDC